MIRAGRMLLQMIMPSGMLPCNVHEDRAFGDERSRAKDSQEVFFCVIGHRDYSSVPRVLLLQMPGQVPPGFEQVVGHFRAGVGVGVGPPTNGATGIVTSTTAPVRNGVGAADGTTEATGVGSCSLCTVYVSPGAQNEKELLGFVFGS